MSVTMPSAFSDIRPLLSPGELKRASNNNTRAITRLHPMTVNIYAEDPPYDHAERTLGIPAESFRRSLRRRCHSPAAVHRGHHRRGFLVTPRREEQGEKGRRGERREKKMKRDMTHLNGILLDGFTGGRSAADRRGGCSCSCSSRAAYAEVTFPETQRGRLELTQLQDQAAAA